MQELELDRPEFILAFAPDATALLARFGDARSAYWTGDEVTMPREDELVQRVDVVFAVSGPAYQRNIARAARRVHRMPMAIDPEPFVTAAELGATPPDLVGLPRPFIGYGGGMSRRMNWELIAEVARHATGTVVLVGPVLDGVARVAIAGLIKRDNVRWLGHRDAEAVPHYLATLDVGLIPYVRNAFNDGSNPVKAYEYLAAGIPVVGTCIPSLVELGELIDCEDDPERFVAAVAAAARPERRAPELVARRRLAARAHDYTALVRRIHDVLGGRDANGT
ncbi:MAG: glycosyltransferase [Acidimicrobiia bacterium]